MVWVSGPQRMAPRTEGQARAMTILANRTDISNYALASHEVKAGKLQVGDILDIRGGARIVQIKAVPACEGRIVHMLCPAGVTIRSYDDTDLVSVLVG